MLSMLMKWAEGVSKVGPPRPAEHSSKFQLQPTCRRACGTNCLSSSD